MKIKDLEVSITNFIAYSNALRDNLAIIQEDLDKNPQSYSQAELTSIGLTCNKLSLSLSSITFIVQILQDYSKLEMNVRKAFTGDKTEIDMQSIIKYLQRFSTKEQQQILSSLGEGK